MQTIEILEAYKISWNAINKANNHGNITIQRSHTQMLALTAQTIELLGTRLMELEARLGLTDTPVSNPEPVIKMEPAAIKEIMDAIDAQMVEKALDVVSLEGPTARETTIEKIVREAKLNMHSKQKEFMESK